MPAPSPSPHGIACASGLSFWGGENTSACAVGWITACWLLWVVGISGPVMVGQAWAGAWEEDPSWICDKVGHWPPCALCLNICMQVVSQVHCVWGQGVGGKTATGIRLLLQRLLLGEDRGRAACSTTSTHGRARCLLLSIVSSNIPKLCPVLFSQSLQSCKQCCKQYCKYTVILILFPHPTVGSSCYASCCFLKMIADNFTDLFITRIEKWMT